MADLPESSDFADTPGDSNNSDSSDTPGGSDSSDTPGGSNNSDSSGSSGSSGTSGGSDSSSGYPDFPSGPLPRPPAALPCPPGPLPRPGGPLPRRRRGPDPEAAAAEAERMELLLATGESFAYPAWRRRYLAHPVRGPLTRRLVWRFQDDGPGGRCADGCWRAGVLCEVTNVPIAWPSARTRVSLWHPMGSAGGMLTWDYRLGQWGVASPFEQVRRPLIEPEAAERDGRVCERFAGRLLDRGAALAMCGGPGWRYRPGPGGGGALTWTVRGTGLRAELAAREGGGGLLRCGGIRFVRAGAAVSLGAVPRRLFSEALWRATLLVRVSGITDGAEGGGRPRRPRGRGG